ncbi:MAG: hypothetical protein LQ339_008601 [Xanthoria mediterranea]|nr:MAG: hypothetical protein LQ339_008601 [Xanthoria mediterranea]
MHSNAAYLYSRFTGLKSKSPGLHTWISVGGWSFTDPGPTRTAFSSLAGNAGNRHTFISGLINFMDTYGFDGVDLDWEYPAADDGGGVDTDTAKYVLLAQEMKSAFDSKYGLSITLPTLPMSYWYLQHFDLKGIHGSIDWFNLMAYDLHGTWDAQSIFVGPYITPHTNITEIDAGLDLLWRAGLTLDKVVMGEGWYGRSFTLKDPSCNRSNGICQFSGGANAGPCSNAVGILDYQEIQDIIKSNNLNPVHDKKAAVKWITWDGNQWVSYDDDDTFQQKREFASSRCLDGLMVWAMDQKDQGAANGLAPSGVAKSDQDDAEQMTSDRQAGATCYTSNCGDKCKKGTNQVSQMNGQPCQTSTSDRCPKGKYQSLCCDDGTIMGSAYGEDFAELVFPASVDVRMVRRKLHATPTITTNMKIKPAMPAPSKDKIKKDAKDAAKRAAEGVAENAALDLAPKAFCRVAVPALLAPLELLEDLIPIIGEIEFRSEIADLAEIAATPAIIKACVKGIEKEGKAEFKVFGKKKTLSLGSPTGNPPETRPPPKSHTSPKTSGTSSCAGGKKRAPCLRVETQWGTTTSDILPRTTKTCSGNQYTQACFHYQSVIRENSGTTGSGLLDGCKDPACSAKGTNILPLISGKAAVASSGSVSSQELTMEGQDPRYPVATSAVIPREAAQSARI